MLLFVFSYITTICTGEIESGDHNALGVRRGVVTVESARRGTCQAKSVRRGADNLHLWDYVHGFIYNVSPRTRRHNTPMGVL